MESSIRRLTLALLCLLSFPVSAIDIRFTPLLGFGTGISFTLGAQWMPINDFGTVAFWNSDLGNASLTDGNGFRDLTPPAPGNFSFNLRNFGIDNANQVTVELYSSLSPLEAQLYRQTLGESAQAVSGLYGGYSYYLESSPAGITGFNAQQGNLYRVDSLNAYQELPLPPGYSSLGSLTERPQILRNGDVYVAAASPNGRAEILRYAASLATQPVAPEPTVVYVAPLNANVAGWGVNNRGDLVVSERGGEFAELQGVRVIRADGTASVVTGTVSTPYSVELLNLSDTGLVGMVRTTESGVQQLLYAESNQPAVVVLETGMQYADRELLQFIPTSEMNEYGQMTLFMHLDRPLGGGEQEYLAARVNPSGSDPSNPVPPLPCEPPSNALCFETLPGSISSRPGFFDPEFAIGYEYHATTNTFSGVEIPFAYGDGVFDLFLFDSSTGRYFDTGQDIVANQYFSFASMLGLSDGVSRFALYGIEESAQVLPGDPTGFVSGLTFTHPYVAARFSMSAITAETAAVPAPSVAALLLVGLVAMATRLRAENRRPAPGSGPRRRDRNGSELLVCI